MKKVTTLLNIAGIAAIIGSLIFYSIPVIMALFIIMGLYFIILASKDLNTLYRHRVPILVLGILFCFINLITGVLAIIAYDSLETMKKNGIKAPPSKDKIDKESRKIDLLLKLGVAMVFIAGILFATTSWEVITNLVKLIILTVLALFFLGLSIFSEKELKIENTTRMYWLLSMSFFFLAIFGCFYYGAINSYLSFSGEGDDIAIGITSFATAILSLGTAYKFKVNFFKYLGYLAIFIGIDSFATLAPEVIVNIVSHIYLLFFIIMVLVFKNDKPIYRFSKYLIYVFGLLPMCTILELSEVSAFIFLLLTILGLFIISKKGNIVDKVIPFILMFYQITAVVYSFDLPYRELIVITLISIIAVINRFELLDKSIASNYTTSIMHPFLALTLFTIAVVSSPLEGLLVSIVYLIYVVVSGITRSKENQDNIEFYLQPIAVLLFVIGAVVFINSKSIEISFLQFGSILTLIYAIIHLIVRNKNHKIEYLVFTLSTLIITLLCNTISPDTISTVLLLLSSAYLVLYYNNKNQILRNISYIISMFAMSILLLVCNLISDSAIINSVTVLWLFVMLLLLLYKDKQLRIINYFAIIVPLYSLLLTFQSDYIYFKIVLSILGFYLLFLVVHHILPNKLAKNIGAGVGTSLIILQLFFIIDVLMGVYVGLIGIGLIGISYIYKDYSSLFWIGLVTTILNIIYQLKDLWGQLPFWLYLLICGLGIIIFVTYIELKRTKNE